MLAQLSALLLITTTGKGQSVRNGAIEIERTPGAAAIVAAAPAAIPSQPALSPQAIRARELSQRFPDRKIVFPNQLAKRSAEEPYAIGIEDQLRIMVWQHPDLTVDVIVRPDGKVSLPAVGQVQANGVPITTFEDGLTQMFAVYVKDPRVTVMPLQMNSRKVFFAGRVRSPNLVVLKRTQTLLETMTEVAVIDDADLAESYVLRKDLVIPVDLIKLLDGDVREDLVLEPLDTVVLPAMDKEVFVLGEVTRPGKLRVSRRAALLDALSQAGGPTERASVAGAYLVREGQYVPLKMDNFIPASPNGADLSLQTGDLIFVPNAEDNKVYVMGEVNNPGPIRSPKLLTLTEAIASAGGFNIAAAKDSVRIIRGNPTDPMVLRVDLNQLLKGKSVPQVQLNRGDIVYVPQSGLASWNRFVSAILPGITSFLVTEAVNASVRR